MDDNKFIIPILIVIVFSFIGFVIEYLNECLFGSYCKTHYSHFKLFKTLPFLPIYGIGALILYYSTSYLSTNFNIIEQFGIILITLTIFELICGYIGEMVNGVKSWQYKNGYYIELKHSFVFAVLGFLTFKVFEYNINIINK